jgi:hypothetical protein
MSGRDDSNCHKPGKVFRGTVRRIALHPELQPHAPGTISSQYEL